MSLRLELEFQNAARLAPGNRPVTTEDGTPVRKIHVKGFHATVTEQVLYNLFKKFGTIEDVRLVCMERIPIYAFITFADCGSAKRALNSKLFHCRKKLKISAADTWHQPRDCQMPTKDEASNKTEDKNENSEEAKAKNSTKENEIVSTSGSSKDMSNDEAIESACSSNAPNGYTILDVLNHDCMMKVFSYLSIRELSRSQRVSKRWAELVNDWLQGIRLFKTSSWAREKNPLTTHTLRTLLMKFGCNLRKLYLDYEWSMLNQRTPQIISKFCPNLTDLLISRISSKNWPLLLDNCHNLKSLSLLSCDELLDRHFTKMKCKLEELAISHTPSLTGNFLQHVDGEYLKKLTLNKCLRLDGKTVMNNFARFKNLRKLSLDSCSTSVACNLNAILELVPNLTEFSLCNVDISESIREETIGEMKDLEVLLLSRNKSVNNHLLKYISKNCLKLTTLDISVRRSFRSDITNEGINHLWKLPNLQVLGLGVLKISDAAFDKIGIYGKCSKLHTLVCRHNEEITNDGLLKVIQMCPEIRKIDAYGCHKVNEGLIQAANDAIMVHPNRSDKLVLYIVHAGMHSEKSREAMKQLNCPLIQVELNEEFCDPLLHSYKVCCENSSFTDDEDDDSDDDNMLLDDYDYNSDEFGFGWGDDDSLDDDFCFHGLEDDDAHNIIRAFFLQPF